MLDRILKLAQAGAAIAVLAFFSSATYVVLRAPNLLLHADGTLTRTEKLLSKTYATMSNIDKVARVEADSAKRQADSIDDLATQARGTLSEAQESFAAIPATLSHIQSTADASTRLLASAEKTTDTLPALIGTVQASVSHLEPVEAKAADAIDNLNAFLKDEAVHRTIANVAGMTDQGNAILFDFRKVADKETADWLRPVPLWKKPMQKGGALIDIFAAIARHTP